MTEKEKKALIDNSVIRLHQAFKNILNNKFTVKSTMEDNKELTDQNIFDSWICPKDHTAGVTWTKKQMFSFAEHYHEIKSKDLKDELHNYKVANSDIEDWNKKLQARINELEEGVEEAKYMLKLKSVGTIGDIPIIEKLEQTLKTK